MGIVVHFHNCRILWKSNIIREDLWIRDGVILNPRNLFFDERIYPHKKVDCCDLIISPGFIDIQLNGGFEFDFSSNVDNVEEGIKIVSKGILQYGVTSYCPTIITSSPEVYKKILPRVKVQPGSKEGAGILGVHLEGPFISPEKKGAHPEKHIQTLCNGFDTITNTYGTLDNVAIVTLAPELDRTQEVIEKLNKKGIAVSLGHSMANLEESEKAVCSGAKLITHLFNAMLPFHHRDPGIVGLLTSDKIPSNQRIYYGMIADGIHTNPAALRIAHRAHPDGLILVTDAISAMGLQPGVRKLGEQTINIDKHAAYLVGTSTLAGSIATMPLCVRHFYHATSCSIEEALEAATLHPAQCLGIEDRKGTLDYGSDADFVFLNDELEIQATFIAGELVYLSDKSKFKGTPSV